MARLFTLLKRPDSFRNSRSAIPLPPPMVAVLHRKIVGACGTMKRLGPRHAPAVARDGVEAG
jgi:hypothetical protein